MCIHKSSRWAGGVKIRGSRYAVRAMGPSPSGCPRGGEAAATAVISTIIVATLIPKPGDQALECPVNRCCFSWPCVWQTLPEEIVPGPLHLLSRLPAPPAPVYFWPPELTLSLPWLLYRGTNASVLCSGVWLFDLKCPDPKFKYCMGHSAPKSPCSPSLCPSVPSTQNALLHHHCHHSGLPDNSLSGSSG